MNTHELAKWLSRDYKNIRQDVLALNEVGIRFTAQDVLWLHRFWIDTS